MNTVCAVDADAAVADVVDVDDFVAMSKMWMFLNWHTVAAVAAAVLVRHGDDDADAVDDMDRPVWIANCLIVYAARVC